MSVCVDICVCMRVCVYDLLIFKNCFPEQNLHQKWAWGGGQRKLRLVGFVALDEKSKMDRQIKLPREGLWLGRGRKIDE